MINVNKDIYVSIWLLLLTFLVALMIVIGGLTRLTDSGLSITRWDLFIGIIPPITTQDWEIAFSLYKKTPEFLLVNANMTLSEFKVIYWWEYIHRLLGRLIGLLFIIPLIVFSIKKKIKNEYKKKLYSIFVLILIQGFVGWYMVQSGLVNRTDVSHYRLAVHLLLAFVILILIFWNYLNYSKSNSFNLNKNLVSKLSSLFILLLLIQICFGAFVSGLDAGKIYQTWPMMGKNYFPDDSTFLELFSIEVLNSPSMVQFIHRNLAYLIFFLFTFIFISVFRNSDFYYLKKITIFIFLSILLQISLGILTIKTSPQIIIASLHQLGSIILIMSSLILVNKSAKIN